MASYQIQNQVQNDDSKEQEAEITCGGEYSGRILHCQKVSQRELLIFKMYHYQI